MSDDQRFSHPYEFTALRTIEVSPGVRGYNVGDGVPADNVKRLGLTVGEDVVKAGSAAEVAAMPVAPGSLKGQALEDALDDAGLAKDGSADEKRARLAEHLARQPA